MNKSPRTEAVIRKDLDMGKRNEKKLKKYLNSLPENKDNQYAIFKNNFSTFDFISKDTIAELKSRRVPCMKFHDTMVGNNKLKTCSVGGEKKYVFYFLFTDGLYKWDYAPDVYQVKPFYHRDKHKWEDYGYIPVSLLTLVEPSLNSF